MDPDTNLDLHIMNQPPSACERANELRAAYEAEFPAGPFWGPYWGREAEAPSRLRELMAAFVVASGCSCGREGCPNQKEEAP